MAATHPIISSKVGEGGTASANDVRRVQQLLARAGFLDKSKINGVWGKAGSASAKAWNDYQVSKGWIPKACVDPIDTEDRLAYLAAQAGVLLWVPHFLKSLSAATVLVDFCIASSIPYGWGSHGDGTRSIYGFKDRSWAIVFLEGGSFDVDAVEARSLNCCSFVNLLLSVWIQGNAHASPYDASQAVGGDGVQLGNRYGMPELKNSKGTQVFNSVDDLQSKLIPDRIYHMALCRDSEGLFTKHDVAIINGTVYQSNVKGTSTNGSSVYTKPLEEQWKNMKVKRARVFGPGPF